MRIALLLSLLAGASLATLAGTAGAGSSAPAASLKGKSPRAPLTERGGCSTVDLDFQGRRYRYVRVPADAIRVGKRLAGRPVIRCERAAICRADRPCTLAQGRILHATWARRLSGIEAWLALVDARTGGVWVNRRVGIPPGTGRRQMLHYFQGVQREHRRVHGHHPPPDPRKARQTPPPAFLLASGANVRLGEGSYCWNDPVDHVVACATKVPPWFGGSSILPLVITEPGAALEVTLRFEPSAAQLVVFGRQRAYYVRSLTPSTTLEWQVPRGLPSRSFLEVYVTTQGGFVHYVVGRLRIP